MGDVAELTVEILKQIRDGVFETKAEITSLRNELTYRVDATNERLEALAVELRTEMAQLRHVVARGARISDETLKVSLEDSGRLDALEGRVSTVEAQLQRLQQPK